MADHSSTLIDPLTEALSARLTERALPGELNDFGKAEAGQAAAFVAATARQRGDGLPVIALEPISTDDTRRRMRLAIVNDDMPFLVDSIAAAIAGQDIAIDRIIHPVVHTVRSPDGVLQSIGDSGNAESMIYLEMERADARDRRGLIEELTSVLADVRAAVKDWRAMQGAMATDIALLHSDGPDAEGAAGPVLQGLKVHAPAGRGEGAEGGEPGSGKPQGDFAAGLAPALEGAARTDLAPAATAAPAPSHVRPTEAAAPNLPAAPAQPPVPLGAVPMTIGLRSLSGSNQFEIRLDPKDLGRIDVNLDIDKETGAVQARLVVDRPETLALLQRDAGNLQQALAQAGLNPGEGSIDLSLRGDGQSDGRSNGSGGDGQRSETGRSARADGPDPNPIAAVPMRRYGALSGIDIRI